ncbi:hypothetical protein [Acidiphilium sp.]|uniref:hypothetical protein n=1 Tax=Acidiphilium sp. TaxID=527 RepID=UPI003CFBD0FE
MSGDSTAQYQSEAISSVTRPLAELFGALEIELSELSVLSLGIQSVLGSALAQNDHDPSAHQVAQSLDLITQRLDGLCGFLAKLNPQVPDTWHLDFGTATDGVTLSDLARRLQGLPADYHPSHAGSFELF